MKAPNNDWQKPLLITFILYVFIYVTFFLIPGLFLVNDVEFKLVNSVDIMSKNKENVATTSIKKHIILHEPFNALSPVGVRNWQRVIFPIDTTLVTDASIIKGVQEYNRIKKGSRFEKKEKYILSDFLNSGGYIKGFVSTLLLRIGKLLFGIIQFLMIFFFLWMRIKYRGSEKSYKEELKKDLTSLGEFISKFGSKNNKDSFDIKIKIRQLDDKLEKTLIEPNDLISSTLTRDKVYNLENSIIRDFYMKGKEPSLQRLNHVCEQFELSHENKMRWLEWALFIIPTVGFIGTVIGISDALGNTSLIFETSAEEAIPIISSKLALAFDTTLLALLATAFMFSWKRSLDKSFFNDFLNDFDAFNYSWITSSYETKEIEKVEKKQREFTNYVSKLLEVFGDVNSKLKEAVNVSKNLR